MRTCQSKHPVAAMWHALAFVTILLGFWIVITL
jgi:hypothetical protein